MDIITPKGWRKGQTIFNFLWFLKEEKGYHSEIGIDQDGYDGSVKGRMADPFHIPNDKFDELYKEFLAKHDQ